MARVLLVDDDPGSLEVVKGILEKRGHAVDVAASLDGARTAFRRRTPDVLLLDLMLPDGNGLELFDELTGSGLRKVVLITGHPGIKSHIKALSGPSVAYLTKPIDTRDLIDAVRLPEDEDSEDATSESHFGLIVGEHESMLEVYEQIERVAGTDMPVLVVGETGTGKELVAESIHRASGRSGRFVAVNCGSLTGELASSELFGHEKGSFTGAARRHLGAFQRADGGTLFLDELTEMPIDVQPHFLRVLETGRVQPVGGEKELTVDVRVVAATNRDPSHAIADKLLRQDLYFRLSVFPILVPPLRERASDIPLLVRRFVDQSEANEHERDFSETSMERLTRYHWPGNVRELKHVVQRAMIMTDENEAHIDLPEQFDSPFGSQASRHGLEAGRSIRDVERELIERTLAHFSGDKKAAAETLGISLNTLYNRLNAYEESEPG